MDEDSRQSLCRSGESFGTATFVTNCRFGWPKRDVFLKSESSAKEQRLYKLPGLPELVWNCGNGRGSGFCLSS